MRENKKELQAHGKIPPQAIGLEEAVLGAILIERESLFIVSGLLKPNDFYHEKHQRIYKAILSLHERGNPIDLLTVVQSLRTTGDLEFVGGAFYIHELTSKVNSAANIESHTRIIAEYSIKRQLISLSNEVIQKCFDESEDAFACKALIDSRLSNINSGIDGNKIRDTKSLATAVLTQIGNSMKNPTGITGVPSGFPSIDKITGGWQKSDLIIIGARPSMGKTAFVVCNMLNAAIRHDIPVALFSLEMSAEQLFTRMLTSELDFLDLSTDQLRRGKITMIQYQDINKHIQPLIDSKIFIDDTPGLSLAKFKSKCHELKRKHDVQMIVIDYLQLMTVDGNKGNREQEVSTISRGLKIIAKELNVPVIALAQLSRNVETRGGDKRPQLSDLRDSGGIEQDADLIAFLYRAEYYGITEDETGAPTAGIGEVLIRKHRNGSLEDIILRFVSRKTKFYDPLDKEPTSIIDIHNFPTDASGFDL